MGASSVRRCFQPDTATVRLWAVSDIHTDEPDNLKWVQQLSRTAFKRDILIVAGDVSQSIKTLEATLRQLVDRFAHVFYTPGNHDLWLEPSDRGDSMAKMFRIFAMCKHVGVDTRPRRLAVPKAAAASAPSGAGELELALPDESAIWVCPLLSWHHQSFDTEPELQGWSVPPAEQVMRDYTACLFDELSLFDESVAKAVDQLNDGLLGELDLGERRTEPLVTFSHFLPREELLMEKRFLLYPNLPKAVGSRFLRERVEQLRPDVHIFGHTHIAWDAVHDGVRYIQAALAYPAERRACWDALQNGDFGLGGPLLVWSSDTGFAEKRRCRWSEYYEHHGREPERVWELAQYAEAYHSKLDDRAKLCMPDFSHEPTPFAACFGGGTGDPVLQ